MLRLPKGHQNPVGSSPTVSPPDAFASNSQVASRISPRPIDLLAALATGTVVAFALVRTDIGALDENRTMRR
ncbi:DUF389 domain-containing protein [Streptomyces sp. H34-S4]|nr:DUF389 domain-containing protein [Streptomyces sp. H34-S4]